MVGLACRATRNLTSVILENTEDSRADGAPTEVLDTANAVISGCSDESPDVDDGEDNEYSLTDEFPVGVLNTVFETIIVTTDV